jgi:uncharacterized RDD family membrane protein YckC
MTDTLDQPQEERVYKQAGFGHRFAAFFIDSIILAAVSFGITIAFNGTGGLADMFSAEANADPTERIRESFSSIGTYITYVIYIAYFVLLEASDKKATLGKMALGLIAVTPEGHQMSTNTGLVRNFIRFLEVNIGGFLVAFYFLFMFSGEVSASTSIVTGLLSMVGWIGFLMALGSAKTTLHDRVSKTFVVFKDR